MKKTPLNNSQYEYTGLEVAIVGMSCRFPHANHPDQFWKNLMRGKECVEHFTREELRAEGIDEDLLDLPNFINAGVVLEDIDKFDADFFGFIPTEASILDPQQRFMLEIAWQAIEDAGYNITTYPGNVGVYVGSSDSDYMVHHLFKNEQVVREHGTWKIDIMNGSKTIAPRISYQLNLRGPSITVQTTCSTSLVAVHLACRSILSGECDLALAGGVNIMVPQKTGYLFEEGMVLSQDGHCYAFDARANGAIPGSGAGIVVLKKLEDAIKDRDHIHAVIKGSSVNNDGKMKVGFTAPGVDGQEHLVIDALHFSDVEPSTIGYMEAHGTGTKLGDPIEIAAMTRAFRHFTQKKQFCAVGSVKTNIGHLDAAAGIAGLIKVILSLKHRAIPPSLNFSTPNPNIQFEDSPFFVANKLIPWHVDSSEIKRRAAINSFSIGGTNAHVIIEEPPVKKQGASEEAIKILCITAKTARALEHAANNLLDYLRKNNDVNLDDVAYTLQMGREHFSHRKAIICNNTQHAIEILNNKHANLAFYRKLTQPPKNIVFMFPGQGTQYQGMGQSLYRNSLLFRKQVDRCLEILTRNHQCDFKKILFSETTVENHPDLDINQTKNAQLALFIIEYSLAKFFIELGITPTIMIGHSIGEYVAACLAEVFSLEDGLALVKRRGELMQSTEAGAMLAVQIESQSLKSFLNERVSIAAINGQENCVISGAMTEIEKIKLDFESKGIKCKLLQTSHAFHSSLMDTILKAFKQHFDHITLSPPKIPFISNLTGQRILDIQANDGNYWVEHLRRTVLFGDGIKTLFMESGSNSIYIEMGPGNVLNGILGTTTQKNNLISLTTLPIKNLKEQTELHFTTSIAKMWLVGAPIQFDKYYEQQERYRVSLPTYPFEKNIYWISPDDAGKESLIPVVKNSFSSLKKLPMEQWFYAPVWKSQLFLPKKVSEHVRCHLMICDEYGFSEQLTRMFQDIHDQVIQVVSSVKYEKISNYLYKINLKDLTHYQQLFLDLNSSRNIIHSMIYCPGLTLNNKLSSNVNLFEDMKGLLFDNLLFLIKGFISSSFKKEMNFFLITNDMYGITGHESLRPEKSIVTGLIRVVSQENPGMHCHHIDLESLDDVAFLPNHVEKVFFEILSGNEQVVAFRNRHRWVQSFERLPSWPSNNAKLKTKGVYVITGGLGNIGIEIASYLASHFQAKIILLNRSVFPKKETWDDYLNKDHDQNYQEVCRKINKIKDMERCGSEVVILSADVSHEVAITQAFDKILSQFKRIDGVIHCAGNTSDVTSVTLDTLTLSQITEQFLPKIYGLYHLDKLVNNLNLDFCILISSLAAVLGGLGYGAYSAANAFMDAFTHYKFSKNQMIWRTINLDNWLVNEQADDIKTAERKSIILPKDNHHLIKLIFSNDAQQLLISVTDLQGRLEQWVNHSTSCSPVEDTLQSVDDRSIDLHARPEGLMNAFIPPSSDMELKIARVWCDVFGFHTIGINDNFFELGGTSLLSVRLLAKMRESGFILSLQQLLNNPSIAQLAALFNHDVHVNLNNDQYSSLVILNSEGDKPPIYCIHPVDGTVYCYQALVNHLGNEQPFYAMQALGFEQEQIPLTTIADMADFYISIIKKHGLKKPYYLMGYSFGAIVAYEMCQRLSESPPEKLIILDRSTIDLVKDNESYDKTTMLDITFNLLEFFRVSEVPDNFYKMSFEQKFSMLYENSLKKKNIPYSYKMEQLLRIFNIYYANMCAFINYEHRPYDGDAVILRSEIQNFYNFKVEKYLGWDKYIVGRLELFSIPGEHSQALNEPFVQQVSQQLKQCLSERKIVV